MSSSSSNPEELAKKLFIICPIGNPDSQERDRSDKVKRHIIDPPAQEKGYETVRSDKISEPGRIDHQIITCLLNYDLVVADITDQNPNVFYELAVRHAIGKPIILIGKRGEKIPFDVSAQRVIFYELSDPDSVADARNELKRQISSVESDDFIVDSPIRTNIPITLDGNRDSVFTQNQEMLAILRNQSKQFSEFILKSDLASEKLSLKIDSIKDFVGTLEEVSNAIIQLSFSMHTPRITQKFMRDLYVNLDRLKNIPSSIKDGMLEKKQIDELRDLIFNLESMLNELYSNLIVRTPK